MNDTSETTPDGERAPHRAAGPTGVRYEARLVVVDESGLEKWVAWDLVHDRRLGTFWSEDTPFATSRR